MAKAAQGEKKNILTSFLTLLHSKDNINIHNVRISRLKYMLIFPLAPVFANMQGALFSDSIRLFGLDAMTLMGSAYCVGAGALFALTNAKNMASISRMFAIATAAAFVPWIMMAESQWSLLLAILFMFGLGGCAACASFAYTFALNNTERLLGAAAISFFFALNQLDSGLSIISGFFDKTYLMALVAGTCICLFLYKTSDFPTAENRPKATLNPALKLTLYFFVAHYFVEIFYTYLPGASALGAMVANGAVGISVVCLAIALQFITKRSIWNMCNLFFIAMICTYALYFMPEGSVLRSAARFIHGFEQMGYIAAYYLLGCVFKKHGDFRIFKLCLVTILPVSMISYMIPGAISAYAPTLLPLAATLTSGAVFIVFILMSPAYSKHLFYADWSDDFFCVDMVESAQKVKPSNGLEGLRLSPREKEIAALLLYGRSSKEIAGELGITTNTVNFHIKNLHKKLNISNRSELFARFSVPALLPDKKE
ncbi:MAG: helix-turn-helix transcriptional regulator [Oscillospiraceae bacterium]|nr:helix-turn-helix transcriptional regulator [Oscillospiraceae bacterium]